MNDELIYFGKNLKNIRKKRGYTLEKLAELVDISPNHISKLEAARTNPSFQLILRLSKVLNIEMKDLLDFEVYKGKEYVKEEFSRMLKFSDYKYLQLLYKIHKELTNN